MATLSKPLLDKFLKKSTIVATLATVDSEQLPYLVPVWYEWDGQCIWVISKPLAEYVKNLRRTPYAAISIARQTLPYVRVFAQGRADLIDTDKDWVPMGRRMAKRYLGEKEGYAYIDKTKDWKRVYIKLKPTRLLSWDGGQSGHEWGKRYIQTQSTAAPARQRRARPVRQVRSGAR